MAVLEAVVRENVWVRVPPSAPNMYTEMMELVVLAFSKSAAERRVGSSPTFRTKCRCDETVAVRLEVAVS